MLKGFLWFICCAVVRSITVPDDDELIDDAAIIAELDSKHEHGT
jgi:hypothetical protein